MQIHAVVFARRPHPDHPEQRDHRDRLDCRVCKDHREQQVHKDRKDQQEPEYKVPLDPQVKEDRKDSPAQVGCNNMHNFTH